MKRIILITALTMSCSNPTNLLDSGLVCGYIESADSPFTNDKDECILAFAFNPSSGRFTTAGSDACDVKDYGGRCIIVSPHEQFTAWYPINDHDEDFNWTSWVVPCDKQCPD